MKSTAGISWQASGGVSSDEQDRRPEVCAGRLPRWKRIDCTKVANRRNQNPDMAVILDLCGGTGAWSAPYRANGRRVMVIDPKGDDAVPITVEELVRTPFSIVGETVHGIIAAPPCTEFAGSGARWWAGKPPQLLESAITTVRACMKAIELFQPAWWVLENPVGRLARMVPELGRHVATYQPWEYGDPYTKRTCLWGNFNMPPKTPVEPTDGGKIWRMPPSPDRQRLRSITPRGFAAAFAKANP